jgi:hypothetical protein
MYEFKVVAVVVVVVVVVGALQSLYFCNFEHQVCPLLWLGFSSAAHVRTCHGFDRVRFGLVWVT